MSKLKRADDDDAPAQFYPLRDRSQVEAGDTVFEIVRWGDKGQHTKYKPARALSVSKHGVKVQLSGLARETTLSWSRVAVTVPPPSHVPELQVVVVDHVPESALAVANGQDEGLIAWLEMGEVLLSDLEARREKIRASLDEAGAESPAAERARARVAQLEEQLRDARRAYEAERARSRDEMTRLSQELERLETQRNRIASMLRSARS